MQAQTAVIIGSTGLIGKQLLDFLLADNDFTEVRILVRRPVISSHPKLVVQIVSFDSYHDLKEKMGTGHAVFCCVGTTQKKVQGDKSAYRKVDYNIPVNTANAAIENGFKKYLLVSSVGADKNSGNFYLQTKGSVEDAISKLTFDSICFFRPSLLLGDRKEFRSGEKIARGVMKLFSFVLVGRLRKYKPIPASEVSKAMIAASKQPINGVHIYEYKDMMVGGRKE